jgi:hypothetical protein
MVVYQAIPKFLQEITRTELHIIVGAVYHQFAGSHQGSAAYINCRIKTDRMSDAFNGEITLNPFACYYKNRY